MGFHSLFQVMIYVYGFLHKKYGYLTMACLTVSGHHQKAVQHKELQ